MGGGGNKIITGYDYQASLIVALCQGPIQGLGAVWDEKTRTTMIKAGFEMVSSGPLGAGPWPYLETYHSDQAIGYSGLAYVAAPKFLLDTNAGMRNISFEIVANGQLDGQLDAQPNYILADFLAQTGFPAENIGSFDDTGYTTYCRAAGLFLSPALTEQVGANEFLADIAKCTNSEYVWSQGVLKLVPYGDAALTGNGVTFTPNTTPIYDLTDDDFIVGDASDPPLTCSRITTADAYNHVQIEYVDRAQDYNVAIAEAKDQADIEAHGLRTMDPIKLHHICDANVARAVAQLVLQRSLYIRNTYTFSLGWQYCLLEPMDLVTLTDTVLGLDKTTVRITQIDEDENGLLSVTAEECPTGVYGHALYPHQGGGGYMPDYGGAPGDVNPPVIFEAPFPLTTGAGLEIWMGLSGGGNWGGCDVWASVDGEAYQQIGTFSGRSRMGVLTADLGASSIALDTVGILAVDLSTSGGELQSGTQMDAQNNLTACYVDGEIISYATATLTAANKYDLTYLMRGCYNTAVSTYAVGSQHAAGSAFVRLDQALFRYPFSREWVGKEILLKFASFNLYGNSRQDLADVDPVRYTIAGTCAPPPVSNFLYSEQTGGQRQFAWTYSDQYGELQGFQIRFVRGSSGTWDGMKPLHNGYLTASPYETLRLAGGTYVFAICAASVTGTLSTPVYINATLQDPNLTGVLLADYAADDGWPGTLTSCLIDGGILTPTDTATWATPPAATWDAWASWISHPATTITYQHTAIDIGAQQSVTPVIIVDANGTATVTVSTSLDGSIWSSWAAPVQVNARYIRVKVVVTGTFPTLSAVNIYICDVDDAITEKINDLDTSTLTGAHRLGIGDVRLPITKTYSTITSVTVTLQNAGPGSSCIVVDKDTTVGPRIRILDGFAAADAIIDATIAGI